MATVLVVDDEPIVREVVVRYLQHEGYETLEAGDGDRARELLEAGPPDLVVLDIMLPGPDGLSLCRWIRARSDLPVILLTARGEEADRIVGLELGADDYVTKPFSPRELAARVRTVLRRSSRPVLREAKLALRRPRDRRRHARGHARRRAPPAHRARSSTCSGSSPATRAGSSRATQLMDGVWGYEAALDTGTVTVHVRRLREKIEDDPSHPRHLETVWGVGYRFAP